MLNRSKLRVSLIRFFEKSPTGEYDPNTLDVNDHFIDDEIDKILRNVSAKTERVAQFKMAAVVFLLRRALFFTLGQSNASILTNENSLD